MSCWCVWVIERVVKDAATGYDREKFTEIPGIWDDVFIEFSGPKIHRLFALPNSDSNTLKNQIST